MSVTQDVAKRLKLKPQMDLDDAAEFNGLHKQAFRIAFDFCGVSFPPSRNEEYWKSTLELVGKKVSDNKENLLAHYLLMAVYDYFSEIVKDLPLEESA